MNQGKRPPPGRLEFAPEPFRRLKSRFPRALERVYRLSDFLAAAAGELTANPAADRANVFDFDSGLRVIVSREDHEHYPEGLGPDGMMLHVSASICTGTTLWEHYDDLQRDRDPRIALRLFEREALASYRRLSDDRGALDLHDELSTMGIPHWYRPWKE